MQKLRASRYALVGFLIFIVACASACYHFYDLHRHQVEAELQRQNTIRREKAALDTSTLAILSEIEIAQEREKRFANLDGAAVCIAIDENSDANFGDPDPALLLRLEASVPKIYPNSNCRALAEHEAVHTFIASPPFWESDQRIEISVKETHLAGNIGVSEVYRLELINDHWVIESHWPGPPE
jgi:hypothetical protein